MGTAQGQGVELGEKEAVRGLRAVTSEGGEEPSGTLQLHWAGGGAVRLQVECIEAELRDLGAAWSTQLRPEHTVDE